MIKMVFLFTIVIFYLNMFGYLTFLFLLTCLLSYLLACLFINECLVKIIKIYWKLFFFSFLWAALIHFEVFLLVFLMIQKKVLEKKKNLFINLNVFFLTRQCWRWQSWQITSPRHLPKCVGFSLFWNFVIFEYLKCFFEFTLIWDFFFRLRSVIFFWMLSLGTIWKIFFKNSFHSVLKRFTITRCIPKTRISILNQVFVQTFSICNANQLSIDVIFTFLVSCKRITTHAFIHSRQAFNNFNKTINLRMLFLHTENMPTYLKMTNVFSPFMFSTFFHLLQHKFALLC